MTYYLIWNQKEKFALSDRVVKSHRKRKSRSPYIFYLEILICSGVYLNGIINFLSISGLLKDIWGVLV